MTATVLEAAEPALPYPRPLPVLELIGNTPLLDLSAFLDRSPASHVGRIRDAWTGAWS